MKNTSEFTNCVNEASQHDIWGEIEKLFNRIKEEDCKWLLDRLPDDNKLEGEVTL